MLKYKICVAGSKGVGKSSLITRYLDDTFNEKSMQTIGVAFRRKEIKIKENLSIELNIWDFGGEEKYRILFPAYVNGAAAALLLYDTTDKNSLHDIENWVQIIDNNSKEIIKVTIGTKTDLKEHKKVSEKKPTKKTEKTDKKDKLDKKKQDPILSKPISQESAFQTLERLNDLLKKGIITQEEFDKNHLFVLSGIGVKHYYRQQGFKDTGVYLQKTIS